MNYTVSTVLGILYYIKLYRQKLISFSWDSISSIRFSISLAFVANIDKHGAIVDSELLAAVYLELKGGRARSLGLDTKPKEIHDPYRNAPTKMARQRPTALNQTVSAEEDAAHRAFIGEMGAEMIWAKYWERSESA